MRKITDFIINKRHFILVLFIGITIICAILSPKVKINHDIAKYLPDTSETRIGMDIMEKEFSNVETSTLNLMFENLEDQEKLNIKEDLEKLDGIESIDYENTEEYNKGNYTLYVITVDDKADSPKATDIYNQITEKYKDYTIYTSGNISESNKSVLPFWIVALAVASALVILLIMCESYVEPFLFLTSILMAVVLNKGTNIIFQNVSNITNSIVAILQMALSMDYSIMLMNRYDQEKKIEKDNVKAMKNALHKAMLAISSSSVTTIVGLLALVFMSFKIGRDLGFVLAKGVLFSLICIFFVLPALILMFDKWIVKTKKKSPKINLEKLGKFSNKMRFISVPVFIAIFIASFMLKGNLGINYTDSQSDEISKVFTENNQIAIIYKNEDEEKISQCLNKLENEEKIDEVLAYGNTINEKLTYDKLNNKLSDLGQKSNTEDYLLKIVYYDYYNQGKKNTMTFDEFINFIENDAYNNEKASKKIDIKTRKDITRLKNFVTVNAMSKKKTSTEIANILEINKSDIDDIFTYYFSKENNTKITLNEFINFMNKDVLTNKKYSSKISSKEKANLKTLSGFANKQTVQKKITSSEMAKLFGIENNSMNELYKYYILVNEIDTKMTISEFSNFVLNDVLTDTNYASNFDEETVKNIKLLATFSNLSIINKQMNSKELSNLFGVNEVVIAPILSLKYSNNTSENEGNGEKPETYTATPNEFVDIILGNETMKSLVGKDTVQQLQLLSTIMESEKQNKAFTYQELSKILGMNSNSIKNIYTLYISNKNITKLTPQEFVNFVLDHKDDIALANSISNETIANLKLINSVMNGVIANKKYNAGELSSLLNMNKENTNLLYGLYNIKYENKNPSISLKEFINFLLNDVAKNNEYSSSFDDEKLLKLNTVNSIMKSAINKTKYTSDEIFALIRKLSDNVEKNTIDMLYTYYGSNKQYNNNL